MKTRKKLRVRRVKGAKKPWSKAAKFFGRLFSGWNDKPARPEPAASSKSRKKKVSFRLNAKTSKRRKALTLKSA